MQKALPLTLLLTLSVFLAGCEKTSETHALDAQEHRKNSQEDLAQGKPEEAATENAKAEKDRAESRAAAANEDRNAAPESAVPDYLKSDRKS
jgi:hypothetical protein